MSLEEKGRARGSFFKTKRQKKGGKNYTLEAIPRELRFQRY